MATIWLNCWLIFWVAVIAFLLGRFYQSIWFSDWKRGRRAERAGDYTEVAGCSACDWISNDERETSYSFDICPACGSSRAKVIARPVRVHLKIVRWERVKEKKE